MYSLVGSFSGRAMSEYIYSIFRLLKTYPETLTNIERDEQPAPAACSSQSGIGKKRKFGHAQRIWRANIDCFREHSVPTLCAYEISNKHEALYLRRLVSDT